jgi:sugar-specific transcriptional regulator TrmB
MSEKMEIAYRALLELGLKPYQAKVYLALIDGKEKTASELVSITNVPQPRIYDTLESLANLGLVEIILTKPRRYRGIPPEEALDKLVDYANRKIMQSHELAIEALKDIRRIREESPLLGVKVIKNISDAINRARKIFQSSLYEVLIAGPPELIQQIFGNFDELYAKKEKMIAVVAYEEEIPIPKDYPWLAIRKRTVGVVPLIVVDSARSLVFRENYALEITDAGLLRLLLDFYYHSLWRVSTPIKNFETRKGLTYSSTSLWLIKELLDDSLKKGYKVNLEVEGMDKREKKTKRIIGEIIEVRENSHGVTISVIMNADGRILSIGGLGAIFEDIEGKIFKAFIKE